MELRTIMVKGKPMTRLIQQHLQRWRQDILADIEELTGVLDWLDEQIRSEDPDAPAPAPVPPEPPASVPEPPSEAPTLAAEAPVSPEPSEAAAEPQKGGRWGTYTRVSLAQVRDVVRARGPSTVKEVAEVLGCSDGNVRPKLQQWVEKGTMESEKIVADGSWTTVYRIKGVEHSPLRARRERSPSSLRLVGGVAKTGKRNVKVMKRRGKIKGAKGQ